MAMGDESTRLAQDIERWIGTPWRRALLATLVTLVAAAATTVQVGETLELRQQRAAQAFGDGRDVPTYDVLQLYAQQLCVWAPWGLIGGPLVYLARWIFRQRRSWVVAAAVQVPLSFTVALVFQLYEDVLAGVIFAGHWLAPVRLNGQATFRFTRELLVYWLVLSAGGAIYSFLKSQREERRSAELAVREAETRAELAHARLATLRGQVHPHFLFNALHSVGGLVREGDSKRALQVLASIAQLLRTSLDQGETHEARVVDEVALARRYLEIEVVRFGERLRFEFEVEPAAHELRLPALSLIALVENAVRHGLSAREQGGIVRVSARVVRGGLVVTVDDDGPGFDAEVLAHGARERDERGAHIGLANTRRRLALLYGDAQSLSISNRAEGGARVVIEIPKQPAAGGPAEVQRG